MSSNNGKNFVEREFKEVEGGYYDEDGYGFYYTPNGSKEYMLIQPFKVFGILILCTSIEKDTTNMVNSIFNISRRLL